MTLTSASDHRQMLGRCAAIAFLWVVAVSAGAADLPSDGDKEARIEVLINVFAPRFRVPEVDVATARRWLSEDQAILVDVRQPKEINVSMLPGAITQRQFETNPSRYQGKQVVAYCTIGYRSAEFAEQWQRRGVAVSNLRGGLLLWAHARGPVVDGQQKPTRLIHVYGATWNLLPSAYQSVY